MNPQKIHGIYPNEDFAFVVRFRTVSKAYGRTDFLLRENRT
jgi:hypothetical protein